MKKESFLLLLILLLTLALRLGSFFPIYAAHPQRILREDSPTYEQPALALLRLGRFLNRVESPNGPETVRTPGYPVFIAAVYAACGGVSHRALIVAQVLVSLAVIALAFALGRQLFGPLAALAAALLLALDPLGFLYSQQLLSETLFAFFFTLGLYFGVQLFRQERPVRFTLLMSLAFILATFVRPVTYYLILPLAPGMLLYFRWLRRRPWPGVLALLGILVLPWLLLIGGWQLRNWRLTGRAEFSSIQSVNLLLYRGAGIVALRDRIPLEQAQQKLLQALPDMTGWPPARRYEAYRREGLALIRRHPLLGLKTQAAGLASLLAGPGASPLYEFLGLHASSTPQSAAPSRLARLATRAIQGYLLLFLALLYAGLLLAPWALRGRRDLWLPSLFIAGVLIYLAAVSAGPEANARFRLPLMPALALFAGAGFVAAGRRVRARFKKPLAPTRTAPELTSR